MLTNQKAVGGTEYRHQHHRSAHTPPLATSPRPSSQIRHGICDEPIAELTWSTSHHSRRTGEPSEGHSAGSEKPLHHDEEEDDSPGFQDRRCEDEGFELQEQRLQDLTGQWKKDTYPVTHDTHDAHVERESRTKACPQYRDQGVTTEGGACICPVHCPTAELPRTVEAAAGSEPHTRRVTMGEHAVDNKEGPAYARDPIFCLRTYPPPRSPPPRPRRLRVPDVCASAAFKDDVDIGDPSVSDWTAIPTENIRGTRPWLRKYIKEMEMAGCRVALHGCVQKSQW